MRMFIGRKSNNCIRKDMNQIVRRKAVYGFLLPSFAGVCIFYFIPYIDVFRRAFFSAAGGEFQGLDNFKTVLTNPAFQLAVKNTGLFMLVCIPLLLSLSLVIAVWIYRHSKIGNFLKTGFLLPMDRWGTGTCEWMDTRWAFVILVVSYIWKNLGYHIVLWLAGLSMIPDQIYEAAQMDGASDRVIFFRITLPNLLPMLFIIAVLALLNSFKVFREVYLVAGNYPNESIYMIQHLFNNWFRDLALDKMTAGAVLLSILLILLIFLLQKAWEDRA